MNGYAVYESRFGFIKISYEEDKIILIKKIKEVTDFGIKNDLTNKTFNQIEEYFNGKRKEFNIKFILIGTEFQKKVWDALLTIPYGETRTYKQIAIMIGNDLASRAVGMANNKNPISIVVPCHRVIGSNKKLVGYAGGLDMKKKLLEMESKNK